MGGIKKKTPEGGITQQLIGTLGKMGIFITLIVVIVSWVYTWIQKTFQ